MDYPWGISGPQFLALYCIALGLVLGWALRARYRLRRPPAPAFDRRPELAELAFLAGGPQRAVEAAIAELVDAGRLHLARNGRLTAESRARSDDELHDAVLRTVAGRSGSVGSVVRGLSDGKTVAAIGDRLVEGRLLVAPAQASAVRRRTVLWSSLLGAVGVLRIIDGGLRHGRPVGYLAMLVLLTGVIVVVVLKRGVKARTVHGDRVLAAARGAEPHSDVALPPAAVLAGAAGAVAFGGLVAFPDEAVRNALILTATRSPAATSSTGTGCSSWGYSGSDGYASSDTSGGGSGGDSGSTGGGSSCGGSGSSCGGGCGGGCGSS